MYVTRAVAVAGNCKPRNIRYLMEPRKLTPKSCLGTRYPAGA